MKHISAAEVENSLWEILVEVAAGATIVVTDNVTGEPIAEFNPCHEPFDLNALEE